MRVKLYRYNGLSDVANKIDSAVLSFDSAAHPEFEIYGSFSPYAAVFSLSELHDCNLASYEFGGKTYIGSVYTTTLSNGLFQYTVTLDTLATAWANGCMDTDAIVIYSENGETAAPDGRNPREHTTNRIELFPEGTREEWDDPWVLMSVFDPWASESYEKPYAQTPAPVRNYLFVRRDDLSINGVQNYRHFIKNAYKTGAAAWGVRSDLMNKMLATIIKSIIIPAPIVKFLSSTVTYTTIPFNVKPDAISDYETLTVPNTDSGAIQGMEIYWGVEVSNQLFPSTNPVILGSEFEFDISSYNNGEMRGGNWLLSIPFIGRISIAPETIPNDAVLVGVAIALDVQSSTWLVNVYSRKSATSPKALLPNCCFQFPVMECVPTPTSTGADYLGQTVNKFYGAVQSGVNGGVNGYMSAGVAGSIVGAISGAGSQALSSEIDLLGHSATSPGFSNTIGGSDTRPFSGVTSAYVDYPQLSITYQPYHTPAATFAGLWGYPDGAVRTLTGLTGYVRTQNAILLRNGLPDDIVRQAEAACNAGFRKAAS